MHDVGVLHAGLQRRLAHQRLGHPTELFGAQLTKGPAALSRQRVVGLWGGRVCNGGQSVWTQFVLRVVSGVGGAGE